MTKKNFLFWEKIPSVTRAILWAMLATIFMTGMSVLIKFVGQSLPSFEIAWFRAFFGLIIILPFIMQRGGIKAIHTKKLKMHLIRGILAVLAMLSGFYAVTELPLTLVTTLGFSRPLLHSSQSLLSLPRCPISIHARVRSRFSCLYLTR